MEQLPDGVLLADAEEAVRQIVETGVVNTPTTSMDPSGCCL